MFLKSLHVVGFKTFADETEIQFDPGFTAVVGPNGSGKSNIVDAIKWVLGEKSAKNIRGEKMEDVIFHGSENREASGFAEVSVNIDNSAKLFKIDFPTVKITRRIFPDLNNEYFINNTRVLRKDVEKLLLDTGVGKSTYSIMEQGRVEAILNSKPEDRRAIFDEAAGVSRFKLDRLETEKKLEFTTQNLQRIADIMHTMERELETKEKQAERAKKYFSLKNDLANADKSLRYLKWKSIRNRLNKADLELSEVKAKHEIIQAKIGEDANRLDELEREKYSVEDKIKSIDKQLVDFISKKEILKEKVDKNKSIIYEYETRISELKVSLESDRTRADRFDAEISELKNLVQSSLENRKITESSIHKFLEQRKDFEIEQENLFKEIKSLEFSIQENEKTLTTLKTDLKEIIVGLINQIESRKRESEKTESERNELKKYLLETLEDWILKSENSNPIIPNFVEYQHNLTQFLQMEDVFRDILFDKDGMLSHKEALDSKMEELVLLNDSYQMNIREKNKRIEETRVLLEENKEEVYNLEKLVLEINSKINSTQENLEKTHLLKKETEERIFTLSNNIDSIANKKTQYEQEVNSLEEEINASYSEFLNISKVLETEKLELTKILEKIQELKSITGRDSEEYKSLIPQMSELDRKTSGLKVQLDNFNEELYNDYSLTEKELEEEHSSKTLKQEALESRLREVKSEIQLLGSINPLAIEEHKNIKEIYDHHKSQKEDIERSKNDIEKVLKDINSESEKIFLETFEKIQMNFQETFSTLFNGGKASLELTDKSDLTNSGVEIIAEPPGKHVQNLKLLSGGEKSLTVIALLFAIYMVRPSPFCFLDEIDAALDEVNKVRFCQILDKFKNTTQFIVVTHAPPTISRANTIFGVTSEEPGISKVISLKMEEAKQLSKKLQAAV
ncbi:MAG: AAA family ATPase [Leptospiraceae bacterium]|nr:AAA family ATPase [Leptospiraceae bacterium]